MTAKKTTITRERADLVRSKTVGYITDLSGKNQLLQAHTPIAPRTKEIRFRQYLKQTKKKHSRFNWTRWFEIKN